MMTHGTDPNVIGDRDLYSFIESMHDDVVICNNQGVILWVSPSFEVNYGITRDEIVGKSTYEMERQKVFDPSVASIVLRTKKKATILEQSKTGRKLVVTGFPLFNKENEIERVISYAFDATYFLELKEQYENLIDRFSSEIRELREKEVHIPGIISNSVQMNNVLKLVKKVAPVETNLLITGESGVGKNLIARLIHQNSSRDKGPFIEVNCGAIPENLLESELFGYEPGAFTGALRTGKMGMIELAQGGTLFLDEVGELPLNLQVKLLKVIQDKTLTKIGGTQSLKVDFRLATATNRDLKALVKEGRFRQDLFYRLNVVPIHVPPLRERPEDLLPLIIYFLKQANKRYHKHKTLSSQTLNMLLAYSWPGNVRELQNIIERLVIIADEEKISADSLPDSIKDLSTIGCNERNEELTLNKALEMVERQMVQKAYERYKTSVGVGKALGISQPSAVRKLKKYIPDYS